MASIQVSDQTFAIANAVLEAYIGIGESGWRVSWNIELAAEPHEVNGCEWAPTLSSHSFDVDFRRAYIEEIEVDLPPSEGGEPAFLLYIFEHEPVEQARLKVSRWHGATLSVNLTGKVAVDAGERYGSDLPMQVECDLVLTGVVVDEYHFAKAGERLSQFFDRGLFAQPERHTNGGVIFKLTGDG